MSVFDWVQPEYALIWAKRVERLAKLRDPIKGPAYLQACRIHYRDNIADFVEDWGVTVDPRNAGSGRPVIMPFVLFPKQREFIDWLIARWRGNDDGVLVKSRDCGASWLAMATSVGLCLFWKDVTIGFGSAKEEKVDRSGDPDCLFYKGRKFVEYLPREFKGAWELKKNSAHMRLSFPDSASSITGEAGDNIGLGGRKTIYIVDEFAVVERPKLIETNLSANTNCRIEMSTVRGIDNVFAEHARSGLVPRFDFSYMDDPRKVDQTTKKMLPQFAEKVSKMDPTIFNQEYGCDFFASIEGGVIEPAWVQAAIGAAEKLGIKPTGSWVASYDIADLGNDKNAVCIRHGIELAHVEHWSGSNINPMLSIRRAYEIADAHTAREMIYDASGMGGTWHEYFAIANAERPKAIGMRKFQGGGSVIDPEHKAPGTDRKNIDYFENLKAQSWMALRMRFVETYKAINGEKYNPDDIISIPPDIVNLTQLIGELCQPTRTWSKNGKLMIDKTPDGVASPNIADSVMQAFGYTRPPMRFPDELMELI